MADILTHGKNYEPLHRVGSAGLSPYQLRRTIASIQAHLAQELSLVGLATVAQTSPSHFARLFKHATGLTPPQYVIRCRIEHAQRLVAGTDLPLSEIGFRIGCADQSHFTALFRTHVALPPLSLPKPYQALCEWRRTADG